MSATVTPLRAPRGPDEEPQRPRAVIEQAPQPSLRNIRVVASTDGTVEIEIGADRDTPPDRPTGRDFDRNLAEEMDPSALAALASYLLEGIEADEGGRREWEDTANMAADYLGIKLTDPATSVKADGTVCQAVATCMLESAVKIWGTSYAELLPVGGPVKVERKDPVPTHQPVAANPTGGPTGILGSVGTPAGLAGGMGGGSAAGGAEPAEPGQDPVTQGDEQGDDLAEALERDLNWYLTTGDKGYYPDTSNMLMQRALLGLGFKEIYHDPIERKPVSRFIMAQDLVVQGNPPNINETDGRVTARKRVSQSRMRRMQVSGHFLDVPLVHPTDDASTTEIVISQTQGIAGPTLPRDYEHTVFECSCELGSGTNHELFGSIAVLDRDEAGRRPGYPLPYRVALDKDSRTVLSVRRNWKRGDRDHRRKRRFVKFGFIPALGFYDWGLIHLVGNPTQAATMLQRSSVDSSLFSNFPAWAMMQGPASKLENTVYRPSVGEVVKIPSTSGQKITDILMAWPYKDASPQALALTQKLESDVRRVVGIVELPVGEGRIGNTPVGTIMSYIESVSMVPGAVHKADHVAQAEEFELLRELLAEDPDCLTRGNNNPARKWQVEAEVLSPNLSPKADPNTPSQIHRLLKVQGQIMLGGLPQFMGIANNRAIYKRATEVLSGEDADEFTLPEQPPGAAAPDPRVLAAQIKAQADLQKAQAQTQLELVKHQGDMAELAANSQDNQADREAQLQREAMKLHAQQMKTGAGLMETGTKLASEERAANIQRGHDAGMASLDRQHQAGQQDAQFGHEAAQQSAQQMHEATQQGADHEQETKQAKLAPKPGSKK